MGTIVVTEFVSLDGVMEAPGGGEGYEHAGWTFEFDQGPEGAKFKFDEAIASEAMLLGRVTYEGFAAAWPERSGEFADKFNTMPKYVVSSTLKDPAWANTTVIGQDEIAGVKQRQDGDLIVHGSISLVQSLLDDDLVDELRLMVFPVVLGKGKSLWGSTSDKKTFKLTDARTVGEGVQTLVLQK
jgi:dihydrofolate reductase